nr:hypothetical protein [Petrachloros mirabilis]
MIVPCTDSGIAALPLPMRQFVNFLYVKIGGTSTQQVMGTRHV